MKAIDSEFLDQCRGAKAVPQNEIDLRELSAGTRIKVVSEVSGNAIPYFLEIDNPSEGRVHLICDSGDKPVREDIANADLGQPRVYSFSRDSHIRSDGQIKVGGQIWFDTFLCFWVTELFLLE